MQPTICRRHPKGTQGQITVKKWRPISLLNIVCKIRSALIAKPPQNAEINVLCGENTELKRSPFEGWSRSAYSHTCYAYCQEFLPCLFLPFQSIHLHFFPKPLPIFFPALAVANTGSCVGPQNKTGHPAGRRFPC